jgi:hypothetical protein
MFNKFWCATHVLAAKWQLASDLSDKAKHLRSWHNSDLGDDRFRAAIRGSRGLQKRLTRTLQLPMTLVASFPLSVLPERTAGPSNTALERRDG